MTFPAHHLMAGPDFTIAKPVQHGLVCGSCHCRVIDDSYRRVDLIRHVDGTVDTGGSQ